MIIRNGASVSQLLAWRSLPVGALMFRLLFIVQFLQTDDMHRR